MIEDIETRLINHNDQTIIIGERFPNADFDDCVMLTINEDGEQILEQYYALCTDQRK